MSEDRDTDDYLYPDDDWHEDDEDIFDECGMTSDGLCMYAGSEWCDFQCPMQKMRDRAASRKPKP